MKVNLGAIFTNTTCICVFARRFMLSNCRTSRSKTAPDSS